MRNVDILRYKNLYILRYGIFCFLRFKGSTLMDIKDNKKITIALLEDEPTQAEMIMMCLNSADFQCIHFDSGDSYVTNVLKEPYDLLILDWNVPGLSGPEVLTKVRSVLGDSIPVLFITSRSNEEDIVYALEHGADDYMVKPVKQSELIARIKALLRRYSNQSTEQNVEQFDFPPYHFDVKNRVISKYGNHINVTQKEFEVALILFKAAGQLTSRKQLLHEVWGHEVELNTRTVDTHISKIRTKLTLIPKDGWQLSTVYQHGYRLEKIEASS